MPTAKELSILIVDDSELVRTGLKALLELFSENNVPKLRVVGEATTVAKAISEAHRLKPDVVLLDVRLPDGSGINACRQILAADPELKILVLTSVIDDNLVYEAMINGAHGYLLKEIDAQGLCQAVTDVAIGKFILDPTLTSRVLTLVHTTSNSSNPPMEANKLSLLSTQERRVLALVAEGKTNKKIASQMELSDKTVKNYLSNVFEKLKINRRSKAAVLYLENLGRQ